MLARYLPTETNAEPQTPRMHAFIHPPIHPSIHAPPIHAYAIPYHAMLHYVIASITYSLNFIFRPRFFPHSAPLPLPLPLPLLIIITRTRRIDISKELIKLIIQFHVPIIRLLGSRW